MDFRDLLKPAFIIGYTALLAIIVALFTFANNAELALAIVTILTNILTGCTTYYYTKHQTKKEDAE